MLVKQLARVRRELALTPSYLIGSHTVTSTLHCHDHSVITNALTLWTGILLDIDSLAGVSPQGDCGCHGRILTMFRSNGSKVLDLTSILVYLDHVDDWILHQASNGSRFKGDKPKGIKVPTKIGVVGSLIDRICDLVRQGDVDGVRGLGWLHQICCFLKKLEVNRPDLTEQAIQTFHDFEHVLHARPRLRDNHEVGLILQEMNRLARIHLQDWVPDPLLPKHGPGAVSDSKVKCWYDKYFHMHSDARIDYLLRQYDLGTERDYCPWVNSSKSDRTSRFIPVPKTWKTLRGISAEPVELQFYQQAVLHSIDRLFTTNKWWRQRVNLHEQGLSAELALMGSVHNGYATIDLSSASDSVTLELVKEVFKGTRLLSWLLGTRSTHSIAGDSTVKLAKFSPMGSACCFPVECIVFALAAQVASDRCIMHGLGEYPTIRVYGDDIVIDAFSATSLVDILEKIGFSVNQRKSYLTGGFREACGVEAYYGVQIQPFRFKSLSGDLNAWTPLVSDVAKAVSYCNSLYERGFHGTRSYLVHSLTQAKVVIGEVPVSISPYITATFSGMQGSLASPIPTNFNRLMKNGMEPPKDASVPWYQAPLTRNLGVRLRYPSWNDKSAMAGLNSWIQYHEWQLGHQPGLVDYEKKWMEGWIDLSDVNEKLDRLPLGSVATPTFKWVPWTVTDCC